MLLKRLKNSPHPYALLTVLFWSLAYVLTRLTSQFFTPFSLGFIRYSIASLVLFPAVVFAKAKPPKAAELPLFLLSGFFGFFFYMAAFNKGQSLAAASTASIIIASVPVITALLARFVYNEKLPPYKWAAVFIELSGAVLLSLWGGFSLNSGIVYLFAAAVSLSIYNLIQRRLTKTNPSLCASAYSIFAGTIMLGIFSPKAAAEVWSSPTIQYIYLLILGIFSSAAAYLLWSKAFSKARQTSDVTNYMFLTPFLTSILTLILLKEIPDPKVIPAAALILGGAALFNFGEKILKK